MRSLFSFFPLIFLVSCYYDNEEELFAEIRNNCDTTNVTYALEVENIIIGSCAISGCHVPGGTGNGDFLSFDGVNAKVKNRSFERRVILEQNMPPNGSLSACELNQLRTWINQGALNN